MRFIDYAPMVFRRLRAHFGIDPGCYMRSVGPDQLLGNLVLGEEARCELRVKPTRNFHSAQNSSVNLHTRRKFVDAFRVGLRGQKRLFVLLHGGRSLYDKDGGLSFGRTESCATCLTFAAVCNAISSAHCLLNEKCAD